MGERSRNMGSCISASTSCAICFSGIVFQICGCGLLSYDIYYFLDVATNNLAYCMLGLGLWYVLAGILAFAFSSHGHTKCLMISYILVLIILLLSELVMGVMIKADEDAVKDWLTAECASSADCSSNMKSAEEKFDKHQDAFFFTLITLVGFKVIAVLLACCHNSVSHRSREDGGNNYDAL